MECSRCRPEFLFQISMLRVLFQQSRSQRLLNRNPDYYIETPSQIIKEAAHRNMHPGSSTMSVVTLRDNTLRSCHIGDCKLYVLRRYGSSYHLIYESTDQLHGFNFPFQLARLQNGGDDPNESICTSLYVRQTDIVVLTSDGFADNIFSFQLVNAANNYFQRNSLRDLPKELTKMATMRASMKTGDSPFSAKAREWNIDYTGGKVDDTTVVVALISKPEGDL